MMYKSFTDAYYYMLKDFLFESPTLTRVFNERTNQDIIVQFNKSMTFSTLEEAPLLKLRFINVKACKAEAKWFFNGSSDVSLLESQGCNFYRKHHLIKPDGSKTVGHYVGWMLRFGPHGDQITKVINTLLADPTSRRAVINLFDSNDESIMPSCITTIVFNLVNNKLHMNITYRSADFLIGLPNDMLSMYFLGQEIGKSLNAKVASMHVNFANLHIYSSQLGEAKNLYEVSTFMGTPHYMERRVDVDSDTCLSTYAATVPKFNMNPVV